MEKELLEVSFSEVKNTYNELKDYFEVWNNNIDLNTRIQEDLGCYGMDNEDILFQLHEKYRVDFSEMDYSKYFNDEIEIVNPLIFLLTPLLILKFFARLFIFPFSKQLSTRIKAWTISPFKWRETLDLTVGDLIVTILRKKFTERKSVRVVLKS